MEEPDDSPTPEPVENEVESSSSDNEDGNPGGPEEHENFPHMLVLYEETWISEYGNPVRYCTGEDDQPGLVVEGDRNWFRDQVNEQPKQPEENIDERTMESNLIALICVLILLSAFHW